MRRALPAALLLLSLAPRAAGAHGGTLGGIEPYLEGGTLVGGELSYGLLLYDEAGVPRVVLDQALTINTEPRGLFVRFFHLATGGSVLAGTYTGLFRTTDGGCTWSRMPTLLDDRDVQQLWTDPEDPAHLVAVTSPNERIETGALFESRDEGATWAVLAPELEGYDEFRVLGLSGGETLWVSSEDAGGTTGRVRLSTDGGATWEAPAADLSAYARPRLLGLGAARARVWIGAIGVEDGLEHLLSLPADGAEATDVAAFDDDGAPLAAFAEWGGRLWTITGDPSSPSGQLWRESDAGTFERRPGPSRCLAPFVEPGALWGCGRYGDQTHFYRTTDGETFEEVLPLDAVQPACCPAGTAGAEVDRRIWESFRSQGVGPPLGTATAPCDGADGGEGDGGTDDGGADGGADAGVPDAGAVDAGDTGAPAGEAGGGAGCGCGSGGEAGLAALVLVLAVTRSRRSRSG